MDKLEWAKLKDQLLKGLLNHGHEIGHPIISQELLDGRLNEEEVKLMIYEISSFQLNLMTMDLNNPGILVSATRHTQAFLDNGGFQKMEEDVLFKIEELERKQMELEEIEEIKKENVRLINRLNKQKLKTHMMPILISGISALIALSALGWSIYKFSNKPPEPVDDSRLRNIEMKMKQLENGLKKDLDSLQNELYKAQMLIDSYES